jgi:hypothetical protein
MEAANLWTPDWNVWELLTPDGMTWAFVIIRSTTCTNFLATCSGHVHFRGVIQSLDFGRDEICRLIDDVLDFYFQISGATKQCIGEWIYDCGEEFANMG